MTNGTRQGAVVSPIFFSLYLDDLFKELRDLGVGCHMGGAFVGAAGYADDIVLLAPTRSAMAAMLAVCENYAIRHNITFSTDENPKKSKTKVVYMDGNMKNVKYPACLKLNGRDLPFEKTATHLGHELSQACDMEQDMKIRRARYIDRTVDVQDTFDFAHPTQKLKAIDIYCGDNYGTMLWPLLIIWRVRRKILQMLE